MSGGIRTSVKGYTKVKRGDLPVDKTHENTERDNASETTFINSQSSNALQLAAAADCIDKKPANEDSPSNPPRDGLNSNVRVSSVSVPSTRQIEGEILQPFNLTSFRIDELKTATRNFHIDATVNGVRMRRVFKGWIDENSLTATVPGTGMAIAVSFVLFKHEMPLQSRNEWLTEVNRVRQLHNQNLVRLIGYCLEDDCRLLVYEFMAKGSLDNHLFRRGYFEPLSWNVRMKIALGSAKGLAFLHGDDANILYRDFKACNILLDSAYNAKLYNFCVSKDGSASYRNHVSTDVMATHGYAAPEYIATGDCTAKCDVYSFGVVLLEMLTGRRAVDKNRPSEEQNLVEWARRYLASKRKVVLIFDDRLEGQYSAGVALGAANLASQCLSIEPRCRPNMDEVVKALEKLQGKPGPTAHQKYVIRWSAEPKTRGLIKIRVSKVFPFRKFRSKEVRLLRTSLVVRTIHCVQKLTELDMRRYSPQYYSPPRRSYGGGGGGGGRGRSPPRRRKEQNTGSLLVRNIPLDCRAEELRASFERYGEVRDVYIPKDYYTGEPRGFAFIQFVDSYEAAEAQYHMNGKIFAGREISVVVAAETRKRPEEMRQRTRVREPSGHGGRRSSYYGRSRSRSRSPRYPSGSRSRYRSRSYSPAPRRRGDSISPSRRRRDNPRSPRDLPPLRDGDHDRRPYSPGYDNGAGPIENADGYDKKPMREDKDGRDHWRSPDRASRSPSGSRSRSAELSPPRSR